LTPAASPDGHYLAFSQMTFKANMWMLQNFDSSEEVVAKAPARAIR
jgi:hypothetical protein